MLYASFALILIVVRSGSTSADLPLAPRWEASIG